jgi:hypothetical protein
MRRCWYLPTDSKLQLPGRSPEGEKQQLLDPHRDRSVERDWSSLDVKMPFLDGLGLLRPIREQE